MTSPSSAANSIPAPEERERLGVEAAKAYLDRAVTVTPALAKALVGVRLSAHAESPCSTAHGCPIPGLSILTVRLRHPTSREGDAYFDIAVLPDCWHPCCLNAIVASVLSAFFRRLARECGKRCPGSKEQQG